MLKGESLIYGLALAVALSAIWLSCGTERRMCISAPGNGAAASCLRALEATDE